MRALALSCGVGRMEARKMKRTCAYLEGLGCNPNADEGREGNPSPSLGSPPFTDLPVQFPPINSGEDASCGGTEMVPLIRVPIFL